MKQENSIVRLGISVVYGGEDVNWYSYNFSRLLKHRQCGDKLH